MIDRYLEPDECDCDECDTTIQTDEEDNDPGFNPFDIDEHMDRALLSIERAFSRKRGLLYG